MRASQGPGTAPARSHHRRSRRNVVGRSVSRVLQRLTPLTRNCLLTELERLEMSEAELPGSAELLAKLRAEFRKDGSSQNRASSASRQFLCTSGTAARRRRSRARQLRPDPARFARGDLEWISRDLLPTMARDYIKKIEELIATNNQKEAKQVAATFQTKVMKYLESTLGSPDGANQTRTKLAT